MAWLGLPDLCIVFFMSRIYNPTVRNFFCTMWKGHLKRNAKLTSNTNGFYLKGQSYPLFKVSQDIVKILKISNELSISNIYTDYY